MKRKITFPSGVYRGQTKCFSKIPHGQGRVEHTNGDVYEGEWKNGKRCGKGKYIYAQGDLYEGEWQDNQRHGRGKMVYANGIIYEGEWKEGRYDGNGKFTAPDGAVMQGAFFQGNANGAFEMCFPSGTIYRGPMTGMPPRPCGFGYVEGENGVIIEGVWDTISFAKNAIRTAPDGTKSYGRVENGKFIPDEK